MDQHDLIPSREEDALETNVEKFVGRIVHEWNGYAGHVESLKRKRASSNLEGTWEFTVKYYAGAIDKEKRATKRVVKLSRAELMPLLVTNKYTELPQQQPANEEVEQQQSANNENALTGHKEPAL